MELVSRSGYHATAAVESQQCTNANWARESAVKVGGKAHAFPPIFSACRPELAPDALTLPRNHMLRRVVWWRCSCPKHAEGTKKWLS